MNIFRIIFLFLIVLADRVAPENIVSDYVSAKQSFIGVNTEFTMLIEQWKPIKGFEDIYEISSFGRIKSLSREVPYPGSTRILKERIFRFNTNRDGYYSVIL